ncbi:MAG: DUF1003 domain-containing protein [Cytophagaceae bacterium]|nr:DUF1003 domain-containing protein [Cytophagaceae bacterium]
METITCALSGKKLDPKDAYKGELIRKSIFDLIQEEHPGFNEDSYVSLEELNKYRKKYIEKIVKQELGELNSLEQEVVDSINDQDFLSHSLEEISDKDLTLGQRLADKVASFGGSWAFIITFFSFMFVWILANIFILLYHPFDPYPFILLNLILSCLASIQAPIIMMSQNRQEEKDRLRNLHDYQINLKAELEIRLLDEKMDHLIIHQNQRLTEMQQLQADYMEDILNQIALLKK